MKLSEWTCVKEIFFLYWPLGIQWPGYPQFSVQQLILFKYNLFFKKINRSISGIPLLRCLILISRSFLQLTFAITSQ